MRYDYDDDPVDFEPEFDEEFEEEGFEHLRDEDVVIVISSKDDRDGFGFELPWRAGARSQKAALEESAACWVPVGEVGEVAGFSLAGGMVYVGTQMRSTSPWANFNDPALVNPQKSVQRGYGLLPTGVWAGYERVSPEMRFVYLRWLAGGRQEPEIPVGCLFLFLYGLERRLFLDAYNLPEVDVEIDGLLAELERLVGLYGELYWEFRYKATATLSVARILHERVDYHRLKPPLSRQPGYDLPFSIRLAVAHFAQRKEPVPAAWARAWYLNSPKTSLRTAAMRCPEEFDRLFELRYEKTFPKSGLKLNPGTLPLTLTYEPANHGLNGFVELPVGKLSEVALRTTAWRKLELVASQVYGDLEPYNRWLGRTEDPESLTGLALLPALLARERIGTAAKPFLDWVAGQLGEADARAVPAEALRERWRRQKGESAEDARFGKADGQALVRILGLAKLGVEPDPTRGGQLPFKAEAVAFFRLEEEVPEDLDDEPAPLSPAYQLAALRLGLAVAITAAEGPVSREVERFLSAHVEALGREKASPLAGDEPRRLGGHLRWLLAAPPTVGRLQNRLKSWPQEPRQSLAPFLLAAATVDGPLAPARLKLLQRVYLGLGLSRPQLYSDLHSLASGTAGGGQPGPGSSPARAEPGLRLDPARLEARQAETAAVTDLLHGIFRPEEEEASAASEPSAEAGPGASSLPGLDDAHWRLLRRLLEQGEWPREDVEAICLELGLMTDGALEVVNEAAFEAFGEPLLEGEAVITVETGLLAEVAR